VFAYYFELDGESGEGSGLALQITTLSSPSSLFHLPNRHTVNYTTVALPMVAHDENFHGLKIRLFIPLHAPLGPCHFESLEPVGQTNSMNGVEQLRQ
jgi:hypothetical protein